jgi:hypothetical protein
VLTSDASFPLIFPGYEYPVTYTFLNFVPGNLLLLSMYTAITIFITQ